MSIKANNINLSTLLPIDNSVIDKINSGTLSKDEFETLINSLGKDQIDQALKDVNSTIGNASDFVLDGISQANDAISNVTDTVSGAINSVSDAANNIVNSGREQLEGLINTGNSILGSVNNTVNDIKNKIPTEFPEIPSDLGNISDIISDVGGLGNIGDINGITGSIGDLGNITNGLNNGLNNVIGNVVGGISDSINGLGNAVSDVAGSVVDGVGSILGGGGINFPSLGGIGDIFSGDSAVGSATLNDVEWIPNPLNNYHNYTYKFKLVIVSEPFPNSYSEYQQKLQSSENHVVLAETGATKYNITDVSIENIVSPNIRIKSTEATNVTIHITEPLGVSFMDAFLNAAEVLKLRNHSKAHYYLQVSFIGYNEDGSIANPNIGLDSGTGSERYDCGYVLYRLAITNFEITADFSGSRYTITAKPQNEKAYEDLEFRFSDPQKTPITSSASTVGEAFSTLAENLNTDIRNRYNDVQKNTYVIVSPDEEINNATFIEDNKTAVKSTEVQGSKGETIEQMVLKILSNSTLTEKYETLKDGDENEVSKLIDTIRICSEITYTGEYNTVINDYLKEITYHVYFYKSARPIASFDHMKTINDSEGGVGKKILSEIISRNYIRKKYSYIYTGENTEIIDFDIKFNFNYAALSYIYDGNIYAHTVMAPGQKYSEKAKEQIDKVGNNLEASEKYLEEVHQQSIERNSELSIDNFDFNRLDLERDLTIMRERVEENLAGIRQRYEARKVTATTDEEKKQLEDEFNKEINNELAKVEEQVYQVNSYNRAKGRYNQYAEDIPESTFTQRIPISIFSNPTNTYAQYGTGHHGSKDTKKPVFTNILDQTYGNAEKELNRIIFTIRGDPYWIGNTSMDSIDLIDRINSSSHANYLIADNYLLIIFKYPFGVNDDGSLIFKGEDSIFNGVYTVTNVVNNFSNGTFTQTLTCMRENVMVDVKVA